MVPGRHARLLAARAVPGLVGLGGDVARRDGCPEQGSRVLPGTEVGAASNVDAVEHTVRRYLYDDVPWREAQEAGLMWVPVRKPHENAYDDALAGPRDLRRGRPP